MDIKRVVRLPLEALEKLGEFPELENLFILLTTWKSTMDHEIGESKYGLLDGIGNSLISFFFWAVQHSYAYYSG